MNPNYDAILSADQNTRAGLFTATAQRLGTTPQNAEKDFWVCWTLDALFNGLPEGPRLLFKGGTSLSKGFGLIRGFSEDIDVTVFRDDLGGAASVEELQALSRKKRDAALDAIKAACEAYINGPLLGRSRRSRLATWMAAFSECKHSRHSRTRSSFDQSWADCGMAGVRRGRRQRGHSFATTIVTENCLSAQNPTRPDRSGFIKLSCRSRSTIS